MKNSKINKYWKLIGGGIAPLLVMAVITTSSTCVPTGTNINTIKSQQSFKQGNYSSNALTPSSNDNVNDGETNIDAKIVFNDTSLNGTVTTILSTSGETNVATIETVTWEVNPTTLTIPTSFTYLDVTYYIWWINSMGLTYNNTLTDLTINCNELVTIDTGAFENCLALENVSFLNCYYLSTIGSSAFYGCNSLTSINLHSSLFLATIGSSAFYECSNLNSFDLSDCSHLNSIGEGCFYNCTSLASVNFSGCVALKSIGSDAFNGCSSLASIDFSSCASLSNIDTNAFFSCTNLEAINFLGCVSLNSIGMQAFESCSKLKTVDLSECVNLETIGYAAFKSCSKLEAINLPSSKSLTTINGYAFQSCTNLSDVNLSKYSSLTTIDTYAFDGCTKLPSSLTLPDSLTTIGAYAFKGCSEFTSVSFPSSLSTIDSGAFEGCTGIVSVDLTRWGDNKPTSWSSGIFTDFNANTNWLIPTNKENLGWWHTNIKSWTTVDPNTYIIDSASNWANGAPSINGDFKLKINDDTASSITLVDGTDVVATNLNITSTNINQIGDSAFESNINLYNGLTLATTTTTIGDNAFRNCTEISSVNLSACESLTTIGSRAFQNDNNISSTLELPTSITSIGQYAFSGCDSIATINLSNFTSIPTGWAAGCFAGLDDVDFIIPTSTDKATLGSWYSYIEQWTGSAPSNVYIMPTASYWAGATATGNSTLRVKDSSGKLSLANATSIQVTDLTIESDNIDEIEPAAFQNNTNITGILNLPSTVTSIGANAFNGCSGITDIDLTRYTTIPTFQNNCFNGLDDDTIFYIPNSDDKATLGNWYSHIQQWTGLTKPNVLMVGNASNWATGVTSGHFEVQVSNEDTIQIVTIISGTDVASTNLSFNDVVNAIGSRAFINDTNLTGTLTLPSSITSIGASAFEGTGLTNINLADYASIPLGFQNNCFKNLNANFFIPASTDKTTLGNWYSHIQEWTGLTTPNVYITDSASNWATGVDSGSFELKVKDNTGSSLTLVDGTGVNSNSLSITDPKIDTIDANAFQNDTNLHNTLTLPSTITTIGANAFSGCNDLTIINLTNYSSVPSGFQNNCFKGLTANFTVPASTDKATLGDWYNNICDWTGLTSPNVYTDDSASNWATGVTSGDFDLQISASGGASIITIVDGTSIKAENLSFNNKIDAIATNAFKNNDEITGTLTLSNTIASIGDYAFSGCDKINAIDLTNYKSIPSDFQDGCFSGLNVDFIIPATKDTTTLGNWYTKIAKWTNIATPKVYINDTATDWATGTSMCGDFKLKVENSTGSSITLVDAKNVYAIDLTIASSITTIGDQAFRNNSNLNGKINLPTSITTIGGYVFDGCNNLNTIQLNWTDLDSLSINNGWLGNLNKPSTTILVPEGMVEDYKAKAVEWGMDQCTITDGTSSNLGLILGLSLGLGIPVLAGIIVGIVLGIRRYRFWY